MQQRMYTLLPVAQHYLLIKQKLAEVAVRLPVSSVYPLDSVRIERLRCLRLYAGMSALCVCLSPAPPISRV